MASPTVSFILATHNRRDVLAATLTRVADCGLNRADFEIIVVDNASTDDTLDVAHAGADAVIDLQENHGSCAKAFGVDRARGPYIVFLDDDSFPRPGSIERMIRHFERQSNLAAAGFVVFLPDGRREGGALPEVFVGCGVGFRTTALRDVGNLDASFFMQAEEYDLAFRLVRAGWGVRVFGDLAVDHLKTPHARRTERTTYYDTRNNLRVIHRYLPRTVARICRKDCLQRYRWLAEREGRLDAFARGVRDGLRDAWRERIRFRGQRLAADDCEALFRWNEIAARMRELKAKGTHRILLADLGKNIFPFVEGARHAGIEIAAIADDRFAAADRRYRGVPMITVASAVESMNERPWPEQSRDHEHSRDHEQSRDRKGAVPAVAPPRRRGAEPQSTLPRGNFDRIVISNTARVHATRAFTRLRECTDVPIELWFPETIDLELWAVDSTRPPEMTDKTRKDMAAHGDGDASVVSRAVCI